jgi:hypothetical protein
MSASASRIAQLRTSLASPMYPSHTLSRRDYALIVREYKCERQWPYLSVRELQRASRLPDWW